MGIRLHTYSEDGRTGLAAFCDTCGEQIRADGYIVWRGHDENDQPIDARIIHQQRCDPGHAEGYDYSAALDINVLYLANSSGVDLAEARKTAEMLAWL